jgi:hypothetical protein
MKKFVFVVEYINGATKERMNDVIIEVRACAYKGARSKALNLAQARLREYEAQGICAYMRVCYM